MSAEKRAQYTPYSKTLGQIYSVTVPFQERVTVEPIDLQFIGSLHEDLLLIWVISNQLVAGSIIGHLLLLGLRRFLRR